MKFTLTPLKNIVGVPPNFSEKQPSAAFETAFRSQQSPVQDCTFCGRTHFARSGENMEEGELEDLLEKQREEPGRYVAHDEGLVGWGFLAGEEAVCGCPCNAPRLFEDLFWSHRRTVADYLDERASQRLRKAEVDAATAGRVKKSVAALV